MPQPRLKTRLCAALAFVGALGLSQPAAADSMKISYAGKLTSVSGSMLSDFFGAGNAPAVNSPFTGGFIFNLSTPDSIPASNQALYSGGNSQFYVDFGLDGNGNPRKYVQNIALPYNQGEVANDISVGGSPLYDVWTAYGQLDNSQGYEYVETGMVLLSFLLSSLNSDNFPTGSLNPADFTGATCDPNSAGANAGLSCARDMEFHAKKDRLGDPYNIYGDADIYGFIEEMVIERFADGTVPEPTSSALVLSSLLGLAAVRRRKRAGA